MIVTSHVSSHRFEPERHVTHVCRRAARRCGHQNYFQKPNRSVDFLQILPTQLSEHMPKKPAKKLSRRELRDLDVEIGFLRGVVRRDPDFVEALQVLGDAYTKRGRFDAGLEVDEALSKLCPHDPMVLYNLACSYALTKRHEQAGAALLRALDLGYSDFKWLMKDPDLESLRKHAVFEKVKAKLKKVAIKVR